MAGRMLSARRTFGGGSRFTWLVDVETGGETVPLVLRVESGEGAFAGTVLTLSREAIFYRALQATSVRMPVLFGVAPDGGALLMSRAPGTSEFHRLSEVDARSALDDFVDVLAALHRIPVDTLDLAGIAAPVNVAEHATHELDLWEGLASTCADIDPEIVFALAWLRTHAPLEVARTSVVQGDTGPGNFMVDGGSVTAVIDWEFAHVGDPVDDVAWFVFRATGRSGAVGQDQIALLLSRYERAAGYRIDPASLDYYGVFVQVRCAVTTAMTIAHGGGAMGLYGYQVAHRRFVRSALQAIADASSVVVAPPDRPRTMATSNTPAFDEALTELRDGVIGSLRGESKLHARSVETLIGHLRARDLIGDTVARANASERAAVFGACPVDGLSGDDDFRRHVRQAGAAADPKVLGCLLRSAIRSEWLWTDVAEGEAT